MGDKNTKLPKDETKLVDAISVIMKKYYEPITSEEQKFYHENHKCIRKPFKGVTAHQIAIELQQQYGDEGFGSLTATNIHKIIEKNKTLLDYAKNGHVAIMIQGLKPSWMKFLTQEEQLGVARVRTRVRKAVDEREEHFPLSSKNYFINYNGSVVLKNSKLDSKDLEETVKFDHREEYKAFYSRKTPKKAIEMCEEDTVRNTMSRIQFRNEVNYLNIALAASNAALEDTKREVKILGNKVGEMNGTVGGRMDQIEKLLTMMHESSKMGEPA